jgi:hypothetical protein
LYSETIGEINADEGVSVPKELTQAVKIGMMRVSESNDFSHPAKPLSENDGESTSEVGRA